MQVWEREVFSSELKLLRVPRTSYQLSQRHSLLTGVMCCCSVYRPETVELLSVTLRAERRS